MIEKPSQLLRRLEPSVRPAYAGEGLTRRRLPLEKFSFDELLTLVSDGRVRSDRGLTLTFETDEELTDEQMSRLAIAADVAEESGARRALMLIDGRGIVLDVKDRRLVSELTDDEASHLAQLDAAVYVTEGSGGIGSGELKLPGDGLIPPVVARQIEQAYRVRHTPADVSNQQENTGLRRTAG